MPPRCAGCEGLQSFGGLRSFRGVQSFEGLQRFGGLQSFEGLLSFGGLQSFGGLGDACKALEPWSLTLSGLAEQIKDKLKTSSKEITDKPKAS